MDINLFLGISGLIISVISLIYAIYVKRISKRDKELVYETMLPAPVAEVIKGESGYSLKVIYERPDASPLYIEHAAVQYVRFTNFGTIPITRNDIPDVDPLRIELIGGQILDITLVSVTRDVC